MSAGLSHLAEALDAARFNANCLRQPQSARPKERSSPSLKRPVWQRATRHAQDAGGLLFGLHVESGKVVPKHCASAGTDIDRLSGVIVDQLQEVPLVGKAASSGQVTEEAASNGSENEHKQRRCESRRELHIDPETLHRSCVGHRFSPLPSALPTVTHAKPQLLFE
jgi:hypothetical protein